MSTSEDRLHPTIDVGAKVSNNPRILEQQTTADQNAELDTPQQPTVTIDPAQHPIKYLANLVGGILSDPSNGRVARHIMLGFILIGAITAVHKLVGRYAENHQGEWHFYLIPLQKPGLIFPANTIIQEHQQIRLKEQLDRIRQKQTFHLSLTEFYYKGYYMGIVILSFTGALAAIALVLISKKGWAATSEYVITTFFIMTCAALFYGSWAGLFRQEENITNNKVLYLKYAALENELFSYVTTGEGLRYDVSFNEVKTATTSSAPATDKAAQKKASGAAAARPAQTAESDKAIGIPLTPSAFIHYVDLQLAQDNIAIGFDYSQIPNYKAAFQNLGNSK